MTGDDRTNEGSEPSAQADARTVPRSGSLDSVPQAEVRGGAAAATGADARDDTRLSRMWWVTLACATLAALLTVRAWRVSGVTVQLDFQQGHGIEAGDRVRLRGIDVGEVEGVTLAPDLQRVRLEVLLAPEAAELAREGTSFWIERPQVSLAGVRGLDTVVGPRYVVAQPGPAKSPPRFEFVGLEQPLTDAELQDALEVILLGRAQRGLQAGSPVSYRGVAIGKVLQVGLSSDASAVEVRIMIEPAYRELARENSRFWITGGVELKLGIEGVSLDAESLHTIASGGVSLATPDESTPAVASGYRFRLEETYETEWLEWQPQIPLGPRLLPDRQPPPAAVRGAFLWNRTLLGVTLPQQRGVWVHPMSEQRLLCPLPLAEGESPPDGLKLEVDGQSLDWGRLQVRRSGNLALISGVTLREKPTRVWEKSQSRSPQVPEDCMVVSGTRGIALAASRIQKTSGWRIDPEVALSRDWHGAAVVARSDGALLGLLVWTDRGAALAPLPQDWGG